VQALGKIDLPVLERGSSSSADVGERIVVGGAGGRTRSLAGRIAAKQEFAGYWEYVLEEAIVTDYSLVHALKGDRFGNLIFNKAARNFNPLAAMAGRVCIAQVEELVEPGELDPDCIHLPGIYVQRVLPLTPEQAADKRIEKRTVTTAEEA